MHVYDGLRSHFGSSLTPVFVLGIGHLCVDPGLTRAGAREGGFLVGSSVCALWPSVGAGLGCLACPLCLASALTGWTACGSSPWLSWIPGGPLPACHLRPLPLWLWLFLFLL